MSIIPAIFGMDNYYRPYAEIHHKLRKEDIGKSHIKVAPTILPNGYMDCSYTDGSYILMSIDNDFEGEAVKVVLKDRDGKIKDIDATKWAWGRYYFTGWVTEEEAKTVKPDTTISSAHIDFLKGSEKY